MKYKSTEKATQLLILKALQAAGYFVWRQNSLGFAVGGHMYRSGIPGLPDIIGMTKTGTFLGIEVKDIKKSSKQSDNQLEFQRLTNANGGIYVLARSISDVAFLL